MHLWGYENQLSFSASDLTDPMPTSPVENESAALSWVSRLDDLWEGTLKINYIRVCW